MKAQSSPEADDERNRTLYIRLPHTIHNIDEIRDLFFGDITIKLPRQSSRHCHVIFSSVDDKIKNLKVISEKRINNKRIIARTPKIKSEIGKKSEKKIVIPNPKPSKKITRILYITNINLKTKKDDVKKVLGDCKSFTFLNTIGKSAKQAIVKLADAKLAEEYLTKKRPWPVVDGNQLVIKPDTRKQKNKKSGLKMWDGDIEIKNINFNSNNTKEV